MRLPVKTIPQTRLLMAGIILAVVTLNCARAFPGQGSNPSFISQATDAAPPWFEALSDSLPTPIPNYPNPSVTPEIVIKVPQQEGVSTLLYYAQPGDTLEVVAKRFGVSADQIESDQPLAEKGLLTPNQLLLIPDILGDTTPDQRIVPDSDLVYSPSAIDFDVEAYVKQAGGYLNTYRQWLHSTGWTSGARIIQLAALENSINPRVLLALLEYQSGWVFGQPKDSTQVDYPMGVVDIREKDLYNQIQWAVNTLSSGYYGWREGHLFVLSFNNGPSLHLAPSLNAGTVAIQYFFAQFYDGERWQQALDMEQGFPALYQRMFGDAWARARQVEPLLEPGIVQPELSLPFERGKLWSYTGGPHGAWERSGSWAALDFAPGSLDPGCIPSDAWVVAPAAGLVVRSGSGVVVLDLDGDGYEQTGWVLLFLHIQSEGRIALGSIVERDTKLGHPSCEGGLATGTHIHIARKYNGEWIAADGPLPFTLDGWQARSNGEPYKGLLIRDGQVITANTTSPQTSHITRQSDDL